MILRSPAAETEFPTPPIAPTKLLMPIRSWSEMVSEIAITGVEFDAFWYEHVVARVAYFFRWLGEPRATVLAVLNDRELVHLECRTRGDEVVCAGTSWPIMAEVAAAFRAAGFALREKTNPH